jgi:murein DD-endopeptidase MepM/ murein hydrolase activator NlpD
MKRVIPLAALLLAGSANAFDCPATPGGLICVNTHVSFTDIATPPPATYEGKRVAATLTNGEWVILLPVPSDNGTGSLRYTDMSGSEVTLPVGKDAIPREHVAMAITNAKDNPSMSDGDAAALKAKTAEEKERLTKAINGYSTYHYGHVFEWPSVKGTRVTSSYSFRTREGRPPRAHLAMDVGRVPCTETMPDIMAASAGKVVLSEQQHYLGNLVVIDHGFGLMTAYAHLSETSVSVGDVVKGGTVVGKMGATGNVAGPHLHFIFYVNGLPVMPQTLFASEYDQAAMVEKCKK